MIMERSHPTESGFVSKRVPSVLSKSHRGNLETVSTCIGHGYQEIPTLPTLHPVSQVYIYSATPALPTSHPAPHFYYHNGTPTTPNPHRVQRLLQTKAAPNQLQEQQTCHVAKLFPSNQMDCANTSLPPTWNVSPPVANYDRDQVLRSLRMPDQHQSLNQAQLRYHHKHTGVIAQRKQTALRIPHQSVTKPSKLRCNDRHHTGTQQIPAEHLILGPAGPTLTHRGSATTKRPVLGRNCRQTQLEVLGWKREDHVTFPDCNSHSYNPTILLHTKQCLEPHTVVCK